MNRNESKIVIFYIAASFVLWILVEFLTVWHSRLSEWVSLMPYIFIQYVVIILLFSYFIFQMRWIDESLFYLMLFVMYVFEFLWKNPLLFNPVTFVPASFLLASIWGFLTFIPLWWARNEIQHNKKTAILCLLWIPLGFILALVL